MALDKDAAPPLILRWRLHTLAIQMGGGRGYCQPAQECAKVFGAWYVETSHPNYSSSALVAR